MAAWIAAGSAIVGDVMSQSGQQQTNAASAAQAQANRDFQAQQQQQAENWETQMSDTAMQRRVTDLTNAGLNPLLAVSEGGASQPSISPASGSMPSFANPSSAFGNLGQQITGAQQVGQQQDITNQQTQLLKAQTAKVVAETPDADKVISGTGDDPDEIISDPHALGNATLANIQATTGVSQAQATQVQANIALINAQLKYTDSNTALNNIQQLMQDQNYEILKATKQALIQQALAEGAGAANLQSVEQGKYGQVLAYINSALKPISSAAGAASHFLPSNSTSTITHQ